MKLRDAIAIEAMKITMAVDTTTYGNSDYDPAFDEDAYNAQLEKLEAIARGAYCMADAMMRVRAE